MSEVIPQDGDRGGDGAIGDALEKQDDDTDGNEAGDGQGDERPHPETT